MSSGLPDVTLEIGESTEHVFPVRRQLGLDKLANLPVTLGDECDKASFKRQLCDGKFCCYFDVKMKKTKATSCSDIHFRAVALDGTREYFNKDLAGYQICAVVSCLNDSMASCGLLKHNDLFNKSLEPGMVFSTVDISGTFLNTDDSNPLPNILLWPGDNYHFLLDPKYLKFSAGKAKGPTRLTATIDKPALSVGISSRIFSRDVTH